MKEHYIEKINRETFEIIIVLTSLICGLLTYFTMHNVIAKIIIFSFLAVILIILFLQNFEQISGKNVKIILIMLTSITIILTIISVILGL